MVRASSLRNGFPACMDCQGPHPLPLSQNDIVRASPARAAGSLPEWQHLVTVCRIFPVPITPRRVAVPKPLFYRNASGVVYQACRDSASASTRPPRGERKASEELTCATAFRPFEFADGNSRLSPSGRPGGGKENRLDAGNGRIHGNAVARLATATQAVRGLLFRRRGRDGRIMATEVGGGFASCPRTANFSSTYTNKVSQDFGGATSAAGG